MPPRTSSEKLIHPVRRIRIWYVLLSFVLTIFLIRLFYLQVIQYDHYKKAALSSQLKEYEIPAERGIIAAHDGDNTIPIVLNETLYTLFADPKYIKDPSKTADQVQKIIGGSSSDYEKAMKANTRYAVLANKLPSDQRDKLDKLDINGLGTREESYRTYPEGDLAAQLLGFVNNDGDGKYGVEQYLNNELKGSPGELKAITDAQGVPLVANKDNVVTEPKAGTKVVLSVDVSMEQQLQDILKQGLDNVHSKTGSAIIMDPNTGQIKAMVNYPTYNPAEFYKVADPSVFNNAAASSPLEVGSVMKTLTTAAALDQGAVNINTTYNDPGHWSVDGHEITNIEEDGGPGVKSLKDILQLSLNTGATWLLMQMGGGQINQKARQAWYDYMTNHYHFGKATGIEQGYEADGTVPDPVKGYGLNITYANTAFGQAMTATPLQMGAALSAVLNGGTYYQPTLVDQKVDSSGKATRQQPKILNKDVVSPQVGQQLQQLMEYVVTKNIIPKFPASYNVGGKTGTAQIADPAGGYYEDQFNGMYMGFVGGDKPQYVVIIRADKPSGVKYAGSGAAQPIFINTVNMLIDNFGVVPKS